MQNMFSQNSKVTTADLAPGEELTFYSREGENTCTRSIHRKDLPPFRPDNRVLDKLDGGLVQSDQVSLIKMCISANANQYNSREKYKILFLLLIVKVFAMCRPV